MGYSQEVRSDSLLGENDAHACASQWTYQKTGQKSGVVYGELVSHSRVFKEIPCPDLCFDLIRITGFPQEPFFYSRLFSELNRILSPQGKLCFNPTLQARPQPDLEKADETIIYYGMKNGFTFTEKELSSGRQRRGARNQGYSLHLTITDPVAPPNLVPGCRAAEKSGQTLLWFVKEPNHQTPEADPTPES